jgi:flagellar assembly protein FliH
MSFKHEPKRVPKRTGVSSLILKKNTGEASNSLMLKPLKYSQESFNQNFILEEDRHVEFVSGDVASPSPSAREADAVNQAAFETAKVSLQNELNQLREKELRSIQSELDRLREQAKQQGLVDGKEQAERRLASESAELIAKINDLGLLKKEDLKKLESFALKLALDIAQKVVQRQISLEPDVFTTLFKQAFDRITNKDEVIIRIHPDNVAQFEAYRTQFSKKFKDIGRLEVMEDNQMIVGGCSIETRLGYIDASIDTKLELLERSLTSLQEREFQQLDSQKGGLEKEQVKLDLSHIPSKPTVQSQPTPVKEEPVYSVAQNTSADDDFEDDDYEDEEEDDDQYEDDFDFEDYDDDFV